MTARRRRADRAQAAREWVGGRFATPIYVTDRNEPYRPDVVLWLELPDGFLVGQAIVGPDDPDGAVARALRSAMTQPSVGAPRRPAAIRVADASTAAEVRAEVGLAIPVTVAPTPELEALLQHMIETLPPDDDDEPSYFAGGHVPVEAVGRLFAAGRALFAEKPWAIADDAPVIRMDIPALDVEGAAVSIMGLPGESLSMLVFPSADDYEAFFDAATSGRLARGPIPGCAGWLGVNFVSATELPPSMRREAMEHGWQVASPDAYPIVDRRDSDLVPRPLVERDVQIATACAPALAAFFAKHGGTFKSNRFVPYSELYFDEDGREVRLTAPYEVVDDGLDDALADGELPENSLEPALDAFEPPEPFRPRTGRNAPCPCGSGRKYKKCHLAADEAEHARRQSTAAMHAMDERLVTKLSGFAVREYGEAWEVFEDVFFDADEAIGLAAPWSVYGFEVEGRTVVDAYLERHRRRCSRDERRWLDAQRAAWLSVWEVEDVEPGETLTLRDLLSDETRTVQETRASRTLASRDAVLGRIVDHDGVSLLCGAHPRPLPPFHTAEVTRRARNRLRRKRAVPLDRLRDATFGRLLIRYWEETVDILDMQSAAPPQLYNTDGDPLLLTVDHFEFAPEARQEIAFRIGKLEGVDREPDGGDTPVFLFLRPDDPEQPDGRQTLVGRVEMSRTGLRIQTNSLARADALRERIEDACGSDIRRRAREHSDPLALAGAAGNPPGPPAEPSPEDEQLVLEFKAHHYADWADRPLPALNNRTPREYVKTRAGRAEVDVLLKDMENRESRAPGRAFDFSEIRRELGLADGGRLPE